LLLVVTFLAMQHRCQALSQFRRLLLSLEHLGKRFSTTDIPALRMDKLTRVNFSTFFT
jgi:hypothetical protein